MDDIYQAWNEIALEIIQNKIQDWKAHIVVNGMLEHVRPEEAEIYLSQILQDLSIDQVMEYVNMCDSVGKPPIQFSSTIKCSTTCLRYLYHALLIVKEYRNYPIVEIGGGYGGLALAIDFVSKIKAIRINKYSIIDLNIQKLQQFYLQHFSLSFPVYFPTTVEESCFVISNYCLAEMGEENRHYYIQNILLPYAQQGFMVWNSMAPYDLLQEKFQLRISDEYPKTGPHNKVIQF